MASESERIWLKMEADRRKVLPANTELVRRALFLQIEPFLQAISQREQVFDYEALIDAYITPDAIWNAYYKLYTDVGLTFAMRQLKMMQKNEVPEQSWFQYFRYFVETEMGDLIVGITDTTKEIVRSVIQEATIEEAGVFETANMIRNRWEIVSLYRAERIARTEIITASNLGSLEGAKATGLNLKKVWVATPDSRTRDTHIALDGQVVGIDQEWTVGGEPAPYPGYAGLSAGERINCRCTLTYEEIN